MLVDGDENLVIRLPQGPGEGDYQLISTYMHAIFFIRHNPLVKWLCLTYKPTLIKHTGCSQIIKIHAILVFSMFLSISAAPSPPQSDAVAMSSELVDDVIVEAGTNISIGCPGVTRNTFVVQLEWRCQGQCGDEKKTTAATRTTAAAGEHSLLKYVKDQGG